MTKKRRWGDGEMGRWGDREIWGIGEGEKKPVLYP
jgi:hypothetical protein